MPSAPKLISERHGDKYQLVGVVVWLCLRIGLGLTNNVYRHRSGDKQHGDGYPDNFDYQQGTAQHHYPQ